MSAYGFVLWVRLGQIRDKRGGTRRDKPGQNKKKLGQIRDSQPRKTHKKSQSEDWLFCAIP